MAIVLVMVSVAMMPIVPIAVSMMMVLATMLVTVLVRLFALSSFSSQRPLKFI
jgi:hypothetical protein